MLVFTVFTSFAQSNPVFSNIKVKDGLPSSTINCIAKDSCGFMWFALNRGLVRYDGYDVIHFMNDRTSNIDYSDNHINVIVNGKGNSLWAGSNIGLLFFETSTGENRMIDLGGNRDVRCLLKQGDSILWAGSNEGLFKVNMKDESFQLYDQQNSNLSSNIIRSLYLSCSNELWIGTFNGLNRLRYDRIDKTFNLKNSYKPELINNLILDIHPFSAASDSLLWIGTETGLVLFNTKSGTYKSYNIQNTSILNEVVKCVFSKVPGEIYFGTDLGFYKFDIQTKEISSSFHDPFNQYSIANNVISDIFEDNDGVLWLATSNGVSKLNFIQNKFQFTPVYSEYNKQTIGTQVNDIYKDKNGSVWLATNHGVKVVYPNGKVQVFTAESSINRKIVLNNVSTISGDTLGRIWIGTAGGINIWEPNKQKMHTITASFNENTGLRTNYMASFITPYDGSFWVTTWGGGIYKAHGDFSKVDDITFQFMADFNSGLFTVNKKIWAYEKHKIFALDLVTSELETFDFLNEHIKDETISSLHISKRGELWLGAENMLFKYETQTNKIHEFPIITGKSDMLINLVEDYSENIWGTTLTSVFKFNTQNNTFETYPKSEGMALDCYTVYSKEIAKDGQIFFGAHDGYVSFYANDIRKSDFHSNLLITNLSVRGKNIHCLNEIGGENKTIKQISFFEKIILRHDQSSFQLNFSSMHLAEPERNIYAYKLEGFDNDWIYTSEDRNYASYTNLPKGNYEFRVKGTNNDGAWLADEISLNIIIKPPVWASPFAIAFYMLILIGTVALLFASYRNKRKWEEESKLIKIEKEKNEEIALSKQRLFTNVSHEFRTPLTLILGPVENLIKNSQLTRSDKMLVSLVQKNAQRLLSLINQLLDLRKIETNTLQLEHERFDVIDVCRKQYELFVDLAENKQIKYRFEALGKSIIFQGDKIRFESIVQNILSNAFKFTMQNGEIVFKVELVEPSVLKIQVKDSGIGIPDKNKKQIFKRFYQGSSNSSKTTGYGIGLNITKEYCELMNGKIWFDSMQGKGSSFYVELPIALIDYEEGIVDISTENLLSEKDRDIKLKSYVSKSLPTLLLVDDHADTLKYLMYSLKENYSIHTANNGREAFKMLEQNKVDIIVSDIMMDELDGISFCKKVKKHPKFENIPLILLTAKTMDSQKVEGFYAGAEAYLTKPFNMDLLKIQIHNLVDKTRKVDDLIRRNLILGNQEAELQSADEKLLQETVKYINTHITNTEISLEDMARSIGVSYSNLYRKIKAQTGLRLNELVRNVRLKKAEQLISTGKFTISEILFEAGFSSHSYFAKCFKKEYGVAPKEYLQSIK